MKSTVRMFNTTEKEITRNKGSAGRKRSTGMKLLLMNLCIIA
jgi:hypothetical protein